MRKVAQVLCDLDYQFFLYFWEIESAKFVFRKYHGQHEQISKPIKVSSDVAEVEEQLQQECTDNADSAGISLCVSHPPNPVFSSVSGERVVRCIFNKPSNLGHTHCRFKYEK